MVKGDFKTHNQEIELLIKYKNDTHAGERETDRQRERERGRGRGDEIHTHTNKTQISICDL